MRLYDFIQLPSPNMRVALWTDRLLAFAELLDRRGKYFFPLVLSVCYSAVNSPNSLVTKHLAVLSRRCCLFVLLPRVPWRVGIWLALGKRATSNTGARSRMWIVLPVHSSLRFG